jgi:hypothetical protein
MERYFNNTDLLDAHHLDRLLEVHGLDDHEDQPTRRPVATRSSEPACTRPSLGERLKRLSLGFLRRRQTTRAAG